MYAIVCAATYDNTVNLVTSIEILLNPTTGCWPISDLQVEFKVARSAERFFKVLNEINGKIEMS